MQLCVPLFYIIYMSGILDISWPDLSDALADCSKVVLFFGSFMFFCLVFVMLLCGSVYLCLVVTCWERADLLALVCGV